MRKNEIYDAERADGKTYQEIADEYGVTRQAIQKSLSAKSSQGLRKRWPRLLLWMEQNNITNQKIAAAVGVCNQTVGDWLYGMHEPKKPHIDALLKVTGLTYEELFAE